MSENNPIRYSDLVVPDQAITNLIKQLDEMTDAYTFSIKTIKKEALQFKEALQGTSGATKEQREQIRKTSSEVDRLSRSYKELRFAESENAKKVAELKKATAEANQMNKLAARLADSAEGSYNRLAAQYAINKIVLNDMSAAYRRNTKEGQELERQTKDIYDEMRRLQEATGKHTLNVGNYSDSLTRIIPIQNQFGQSIIELAENSQGSASFIEKLTAVTKSFGSSLLVLLTNPAFLAIAGIAGVGASFKFWYDYNLGLMQATKLTASFTGKSGDDLALYRNRVQAIADTYKEDFVEVIRAANTISQQFGISQDEALRLIQDGYVAGANAQGRFIENIKEFSVYFDQAGLSAANFVAIATQGAKLGIFNNKDVDTIKEADIRLREMTKATRDALKGIGLDASQIQRDLLSGQFTIFDILQRVSAEIAKLPKNSAVVGTAIADIFGEPGENSGIKYIQLLKDIETEMDKVKAKSSELSLLEEQRLETQLKVTNALSALFDMTGGDFERMITLGKTYLSEVLLRMIKGLIDIRNWWTDLYNESMAFRYALAMVTGSFIGLFEIVKGFVKFAVDSFTAVGDILKGAFTLDGALVAQGLKKVPHIITDLFIGTGKKVGEAFINQVDKAITRKKIAPIVIPIESDPDTSGPTGNGGGRGGSLPPIAQDARAPSNTRQVDPEDIRKKNLEILRKYQDLELQLEQDEFRKRRQQTIYQYDRQIEDLRIQLETEKDLSEEARANTNFMIIDLAKVKAQEVEKIEKEHQKRLTEIQNTVQTQVLERQKRDLQTRLDSVRAGTQEEFELKKELLDKELEAELFQNSLLEEFQQQNVDDIKNKYGAKLRALADEYVQNQMSLFDAQQNLAQSEFDLLRTTEQEKTKFRLKAEKDRLLKVLALNEMMNQKLSDIEVQTIKNTIARIDKELASKLDPEGDIYSLLGLNLKDEEKQAISQATQFAIQQVNELLASRVRAAEGAVQASQKETSAAQSRLDKELELRNQGYANNVIQAQKDLALARQNEEKALRDRAKAVKRQQQLETLAQASSLVTASAKILASVGLPFAIPLIGLMWGTFAAARLKARQVTASTESYGDGTVELLSGGSHQSGNDVDLGTKPNGTRRRAEGGEFFAVINKRNSRRYRSVIPDVIGSLNKGTFEQKYMNSLSSEGLSINVPSNDRELKELNDSVNNIRKSLRKRTYVNANGQTVVEHKNLKRTLK